MDSFNPFANAWGDDSSTDTPDNGIPSTSSTTFKLPGEISDNHGLDRHSSINGVNEHHDPLGFKSTPTVVIADDEDAWGAPVASTSRAATPAAAAGTIDEWSTAPSTPKPPYEGESNEPVEETSWKPAGLSPVLSSSPPAWAIEGD